MRERFKPEVKKWLRDRAGGFLRELGIRENHKLLDFGCCEGKYTIPAAALVGDRGMVYALDCEGDYVASTIRKAKKNALQNVVGIVPSNESLAPLPANSVDVILLFDTLHPGYFPDPESRKTILKGLHKVLRKNGFMCVYLTHLQKHGMTYIKVIEEIEEVGFSLQSDSYKKLVHGNELVKGRILAFTKERKKRRK